MAYEIGPLLRTLREAQNLTQDKLYAGLLSSRQVIRLEQGASDIKAEILFAVLARLHMSANDLTSLLPQISTPNKPSASASALNRGLAKVTNWADWPLTLTEEKALSQFIISTNTMTLSQIHTLIPLTTGTRLEHLWRRLQQFSDQSEYTRVANEWCNVAIHNYLFAGQIEPATTVLYRWQQLTLNTKNSVWMRQFFVLLMQALPNTVAVYNATNSMINGWRLLDQNYADSIIDNRRHILSGCHLHSTWTDQELGATIRLLTELPKPALDELNLNEYLAHFSGLKAELQKRGQPLSAFKNCY